MDGDGGDCGVGEEDGDDGVGGVEGDRVLEEGVPGCDGSADGAAGVSGVNTLQMSQIVIF